MPNKSQLHKWEMMLIIRSHGMGRILNQNYSEYIYIVYSEYSHSLVCHVKKLIYRKSKWGILSEIFKRVLAEYLNFYWQETDWKNVFMPRRAHFSMSSLTQIRKDDGRWGILELRPIENNGLRNHSQEIWGCNQKHSQYSGRKTEQHLLSRISEFLD